MKTKTKYDVSKHIIVPKHSKVSDKERKELLSKYNIVIEQLPRILATDPALIHLTVDHGDLIKISRPSPTLGDTTYYRRVVSK